MKFNALLFLGLMLASTGARAESGGVRGADEQFFRMMEQKRQAEQLENDFKEPKKPEIKAGRAISGNKNAPIMIVVYSDFQCPYCQRGFATVEELKKKYGAKMAFMFKHLPLPMHPMAVPAAKRFEAIAMQSAKKAYEFHDGVFKEQQRITPEGEKFLDEVATKVKVNMAKMKKDMESDTVTKRLQADAEEAKKYEMSGTPGFIVAGVALRGAYPTPAFEQIIERRLSEKKGRKVASEAKAN